MDSDEDDVDVDYSHVANLPEFANSHEIWMAKRRDATLQDIKSRRSLRDERKAEESQGTKSGDTLTRKTITSELTKKAKPDHSTQTDREMQREEKLLKEREVETTLSLTALFDRAVTLIEDVPKLMATLVDITHRLEPLTSAKRPRWKCGDCYRVWRESISNRTIFSKCPKCELQDSIETAKQRKVEHDKNNPSKRTRKKDQNYVGPLRLSTKEKKRLRIKESAIKPPTFRNGMFKYADGNSIIIPACIPKEQERWLYKRQLIPAIKNACAICFRDLEEPLYVTKCDYCDCTTCQPCMQKYCELSSKHPRCVNMKCRRHFTIKWLGVNNGNWWLEKFFDRQNALAIEHACECNDDITAILPVYSDALSLDDMTELNHKIHNIAIKMTGAKHYLICEKETCVGHITSRYECYRCHARVCQWCLRLIESDEHLCRPVSVLQCTPCSTCNAMITRVSYMSEVWCSSCSSVIQWSGNVFLTKLPYTADYHRWAEKANHVSFNVQECVILTNPIKHEITTLVSAVNLHVPKISESVKEICAWAIDVDYDCLFEQEVHYNTSVINQTLKVITDRISKEVWEYNITEIAANRYIEIATNRVFHSLAVILTELILKTNRCIANATETRDIIESIRAFRSVAENAKQYTNFILNEEYYNLDPNDDRRQTISTRWQRVNGRESTKLN
jgi:hypothetical protein